MISSLAVTRMRSGRAGTFSYSLDKAANVTITIEQVKAGRKIGRVCKKQTRKNRKKRACTLFVADRQALPVWRRGAQHAPLLRQARRPEAEGRPLPRHGGRRRRRRQVRSGNGEVRGVAMSARAVQERGLQERQAGEAACLRQASLGLSLHAGYALFGPGSGDGLGELAASWAFYGLALLARRARAWHARDWSTTSARHGSPTSVAFGAWFIGSVYYASGGSAEDDLYSFPLVDALLAPFAGAAAFAVAMLVRSRVKPFQPTILLDGLIVSLAAGALAAVVMYAIVPARRRGEHGRARAEARLPALRGDAARVLDLGASR